MSPLENRRSFGTLLLLSMCHEGERVVMRDEDEPRKKRESPWRAYGVAVSDLESYAVRQRVKPREYALDPPR